MDSEEVDDEQKQKLKTIASWAVVDLLEHDHKEVTKAIFNGLTPGEQVVLAGVLTGRMVVALKRIVELQRELVQLVSEDLAELAMEHGPRPYVLGEEGGPTDAR